MNNAGFRCQVFAAKDTFRWAALDTSLYIQIYIHVIFYSRAIGWSILQNNFSNCLCFESALDGLFYVWRYLTDDLSETIIFFLTYCTSMSAWSIFVVVRAWLGSRPKDRACRNQPAAVIIQHEETAKLIALTQVGDHKAILNYTPKYKNAWLRCFLDMKAMAMLCHALREVWFMSVY